MDGDAGIVGNPAIAPSTESYQESKPSPSASSKWVLSGNPGLGKSPASPPKSHAPDIRALPPMSGMDYDPQEHPCWFASSHNGWTSDELGLSWLQSLLHKQTLDKARRDWRLLILDGHGSHCTLNFLEWCRSNRILVAVFPPHSTHRLQPLDVRLFRPLATYYS